MAGRVKRVCTGNGIRPIARISEHASERLTIGGYWASAWLYEVDKLLLRFDSIQLQTNGAFNIAD